MSSATSQQPMNTISKKRSVALTLLVASLFCSGSAALAQSADWGVVNKGQSSGGSPFVSQPPGQTRPVAPPDPDRRDDAAFRAAIDQVVNMPFDSNLQARASRFGLNVLNVTWEDTGRNLGSSVGPNISDLTLQVREPVPGGDRTHLLPVLRYPNFSDKTADIRADKLWVKVGNQTPNGRAVTVPLTEVLKNLHWYLSDPYSLPGSGNFLAARDTHFLVSAQHVFMPLPKTGKAEFNPVLYNYQSDRGRPAVLNLLVTREGTSATIIENWDGDQSYQQWGQQLHFNNKGQRTSFTAERRSAVETRINQGRAKAGDEGALAKGADMLMIVQVPLRVPEPPRFDGPVPAAEASSAAPQAAGKASSDSAAAGSGVARRSDVESAVIGHGEDAGPFSEIKGMPIERDPRFPIRVTVQFYKATSNGVVSDADLSQAKSQIDEVYRNGDFVGSLVIPDGRHSRPTEWTKGRTPYRKP